MAGQATTDRDGLVLGRSAPALSELHPRGDDTRIARAEGEADVLASRFAAGGPATAPLASLASYDRAACGPRTTQTPERPTDPERPPLTPRKETVGALDSGLRHRPLGKEAPDNGSHTSSRS